jgi:hypothetical protein
MFQACGARCPACVLAYWMIVADLLGRQAGIGVLDHPVREDASADNNPLAGYPAGNPFNVGTGRPVDVAHVRLQRAEYSAEGAVGSSRGGIRSHPGGPMFEALGDAANAGEGEDRLVEQWCARGTGCGGGCST